MQSAKLDRTLALGVAAVGVFNTIAAVSLPVASRRPGPLLVVAWLALLVAHAALYWFGATVRQRIGLRAYLTIQAAVVFCVGVSGSLFPVGVGLYIALTAQGVLLAGPAWSTLPITLGAIVAFAANALIVADLYRAATAGLVLATTGVVAHAVAALLRRPSVGGIGALEATSAAGTVNNHRVTSLTPREQEVLRGIVAGARSSQIAADLGITERTVKAHLASIYQKLGVESRAAAVAVAVRSEMT